ncbi:MAG: hypothetical protein ACXIUV_14940 [Alkalilacustris sp.]
MTALSRYQRLECDGLWRPAADEQRRDVVVAFGEASLILTDIRSGRPLAHWSLPAVTRRNPGAQPALFTPDADASETLEIEDPDMIAALETVARAVRQGRRVRPRRRPALVAGAALVAVLALAWWVPRAMVEHAERTLPAAARAQIGALVLADLAQSGHPVCGAPLGLRALGRLAERLGAPQLIVLDGPDLPPALALPGGIVALGRPMVEAHDSPEVAAGHVLAVLAALDAGEAPLAAALRHAGPWATFRLLTTGALDPRDLRGHGTARLAEAQTARRGGEAALLARFDAAEVPLAPWAEAAARSDAERLLSAAAARSPGAAPPRPILSDGEWVSLQDICQR